MSKLKAAVVGTLGESPLYGLLVRALDRRLTGTFVFETEDGERSALVVVNGRLLKARTSQHVAFLGDVLQDLKLVDASAGREAAKLARSSNRLLGGILTSEGKLELADLEAALSDQLLQQLIWLGDLPARTHFGFYQGIDLLTGWGGSDYPKTQPLSAIWRLVKAHRDAQPFDEACRRIADRELKFHLAADVGSFDFLPHEQAVVEILRAKPQPLGELLKRDLAPADVVRRMVFVFALCRQLDFGQGTLPVGARSDDPLLQEPIYDMASISPAPIGDAGHSLVPEVDAAALSDNRPGAELAPSAAGDRTANDLASEEAAAFRAEIHQRAAGTSQNYYEVLEVPREALVGQIQAAFFQLAKRWHPDRMAPELDDVRSEVSKVFARLSEAHRVLTDAQRRAEYDKMLERGGSDEEQQRVEAVLRAAMAFQRAEVHLKRRKFEDAERELRAAVQDDPEQAEYAGLLAWAEAQRPDEKNFNKPIKALNDAVKREPKNARLRWYRGQLHQKAGNEGAAARDFQRVVELDPRHQEAARALRLHEMRKAGAAPASSRGIGKWFKR